MAVVVTTDIAGGTAETFRAVQEALGASSQAPDGRRFRAAGPIPGGWRVVSGWETADAFVAFMRERLQPAWDKAGVRLSRLDIWPVEEIRS
jgi:hypothetical protein